MKNLKIIKTSEWKKHLSITKAKYVKIIKK